VHFYDKKLLDVIVSARTIYYTPNKIGVIFHPPVGQLSSLHSILKNFIHLEK